MRVKDRETGLILESDNSFVVAQWLKRPDKYVQPKATKKPALAEKVDATDVRKRKAKSK